MWMHWNSIKIQEISLLKGPILELPLSYLCQISVSVVNTIHLEMAKSNSVYLKQAEPLLIPQGKKNAAINNSLTSLSLLGCPGGSVG